ncbi:MAG: hypothetical protein UU90_C0015G0015 [candidate division WWE3 bacterium GW2011_GWD2_42_11]|nr:MAG: hypothetical protein UU90_C0015G0015 [candidate division WWE3 bacterium GW2011_GWD2_42_11]
MLGWPVIVYRTGLCFNNGYLSGKITLRFQAITALLGDRLMVGLCTLDAKIGVRTMKFDQHPCGGGQIL